MSMNVFEYKYQVTPDLLPSLKKAIHPYLERDPYSDRWPGKEYIVRSVYFDTPYLDYFYQKLSGVYSRNKIRIRGYNHCSPLDTVFLEIKRKTDNMVTKFRTPVLLKDIPSLIEDNGSTGSPHDLPDTMSDLSRFLYQIHRHALQPVIMISYHREAYYYRFSRGLRITFDKNIRYVPENSWRLRCDDDNSLPVRNCKWVMEIKTSIHLPRWLLDTISRFNLLREAISKYALGIESMQPVPLKSWKAGRNPVEWITP